MRGLNEILVFAKGGPRGAKIGNNSDDHEGAECSAGAHNGRWNERTLIEHTNTRLPPELRPLGATQRPRHAPGARRALRHPLP